MAKRTSNLAIKQSIVDVVLDGRKAFWHGEETEVFAANSVDQLNDEYGIIDEEEPEKSGGISFTNIKGWWIQCLNEKEEGLRGRTVYRKDGTVNPNYLYLPLICNVYGKADCIAAVSTSYA